MRLDENLTFVELTAVAFYTIEAVITWYAKDSSQMALSSEVALLQQWHRGHRELLFQLCGGRRMALDLHFLGRRPSGDPFGALSKPVGADLPLLLRVLRLHTGLRAFLTSRRALEAAQIWRDWVTFHRRGRQGHFMVNKWSSRLDVDLKRP